MHFTVCAVLKFRKISVIHTGTFEGTFSTQQCATSYFSLIFQLIFAFSLTFWTNQIPVHFPVFPGD